jgi:hypothetical protein
VEFLNAVSPRAVLVSVGAGNRYRHPDPGLSPLGAAMRPASTWRRCSLFEAELVRARGNRGQRQG